MSGAAAPLVYALAGAPVPVGWRPDQGAAVCAACGARSEATMPVARALGANFTDPSLWSRPHSTRVCAACTWCCAGRPPATIRGWSVVAAPGTRLAPCQPKAWSILHGRPGLCVTNRADPLPVARVLLDPPEGEWAVTVAVSGQKHTLPYTRTNRGAGQWTVRMETADVTADPARWRRVLRAAARLRAAGHGADAVRDAVPDLRAVKTRADLDAARPHLDVLAPCARSPLLDLALWCLTRSTIATLTEDL